MLWAWLWTDKTVNLAGYQPIDNAPDGLLGRKVSFTTTRIDNAIWAGFAHVTKPIRRRHFAHVNIPR